MGIILSKRPTGRRRFGRDLRTAAGVAALSAVAMTACSTGGDPGADSGAETSPLNVVVSFYPFEFIVERIGGDAVTVRNLTPPGGEPHDLEPTANDLVELRKADVVVHLEGFAPSVDEAIDTAASSVEFDVRSFADLVLAAEDHHDDEEAGHEGESGPKDAAAGDDHGDEHGSLGGLDPHFWLDPQRLANVGEAVAEHLARLVPKQATTFLSNAAELRKELEALDAEFVAGLANCRVRSMVTSHEAFGYLALRYGLTQVSVSGLSPEVEPTATALAEVAEFVKEQGVTTVYTEVLASNAVAETLARETGAATAVLDPLEGLADGASGDYLSVMRANLATLRAGQGCT